MERSASGRVYVVVEYRQRGPSEKITPCLPEVCPLHESGDPRCRLGIHHYRQRKTGPAFSLAVAICRTHQGGFTLYPGGWTPYSRKPLVQLTLDCTPAKPDEGADTFSGTLFDAALDAARHYFWPKESEADSRTPRFSTQLRHLRWAATLFGIDSPASEALRQQLVELLQIPGQLLYDCTREIAAQAGGEARGKLISTILQAIPKTTVIFQKLAATGHLAGLWPRPRLCGDMLSAPFREVRTRGAPASL